MSRLVFSFASFDFGTLACMGIIFAATPGLREPARGREVEREGSSFMGLLGLKTGASADILDALGRGVRVSFVDARRLGGGELEEAMLDM
jgi:hypothetical protein